jgi:hypothetical protein
MTNDETYPLAAVKKVHILFRRTKPTKLHAIGNKVPLLMLLSQKWNELNFQIT